MPLNPYFSKTANNANGFVLIRLDHANPAAEASMAVDLADYIMKSKLCNMPSFYSGWKQKTINGTPNLPAIKQALEGIVGISIGLSASQKPLDHRQGWVAEHLWYYLINGSYPLGHTIRIFDVGLSATEPGGDGLVFHTTSSGLSFRLWELKKIAHSSSTNVNQVISKASKQLQDKGTQYVSRFVLENQNKGLPPAEAAFLNQAIEAWIANTNTVGVGISTVSSKIHLQNPNFSPLVSAFPQISAHGNIEGRSIALDNFDVFCDLVCGSIWNGI